MKTALYARVSTDDKGQLPEVQVDAIKKFCQDAGWDIIGEYVDRASADDFVHRTAWSQMMKDASLRKFEVIVIWKLDRAFRSMTHGAGFLGILRSYGIKFKSLMDPFIDTTTPNGELLYNIILSFAQFEKDLLKVRINAGLEYAKRHGTKTGNKFGRPRRNLPVQKVLDAFKDSGGSFSKAAASINVPRGSFWNRFKEIADEKGITIDILKEELEIKPLPKIKEVETKVESPKCACGKRLVPPYGVIRNSCAACYRRAVMENKQRQADIANNTPSIEVGILLKQQDVLRERAKVEQRALWQQPGARNPSPINGG